MINQNKVLEMSDTGYQPLQISDLLKSVRTKTVHNHDVCVHIHSELLEI